MIKYFCLYPLDQETLVDGGVEEEWQCVPWTKAEHPTLEQDECLVYLPTCVLLISKYPYFTTMKDCLSRSVTCSLSVLCRLYGMQCPGSII